ncbi:MAG: DegT/DnrJ/EryC1/StrS family aminotransferase [Planctomycetes bacterium]|nr:DegT/DnrJ/EryC1/StrS family aminotransferase [Planctomycetota bacterium]
MTATNPTPEPRVEFFRHALGDEEKARVLAALDETILTTGKAVAEAEQALAAYLGVAEVVCLDSCTAALHLALLANDIGPGDEVIVPAATFVATANAVVMAGATPVFTDVDPRTGCITLDTVKPRITPRTRAIIPVHLYGLLCDMESLAALARARNLLLIEDSAHCLEARRGGVRPASHSRCACLSFYATKAITCGEGGALATNDRLLARRVRRLSLHGIDSSAAERYRKKYRHWDMAELGWKYNLDNVRGSLLLPQIPRLDAHCERRRRICERYELAFADIAGLTLFDVPQRDWSARHLFAIQVDPERRDALLDALDQRGVGVVVNYRAVHLLSYYVQRFGYQRGDLPHAESIGDRTISLPLFPTMTDEQTDRVIAAVLEVVGGGRVFAEAATPARGILRTMPGLVRRGGAPAPTGEPEPARQAVRAGRR